MTKDSIKIAGEKSKIQVNNVEDVKISGDDNVIKIDGDDRDIEIRGDDNIIHIKEEEGIKKEFGKTFKFFQQKKIILAIVAILFLIILISSVWVRTQNLDLLKDATSGKRIPLALDPYYFLRIAETMIEQGGLPEVDAMRYPALNVGFTNEILPDVLVIMYKVMNVFGDYSIGMVDVLSPVIFFALGLIVFYFLIYVLTKSKLGALLGSAFLAFIPSYLYRTMAGFADHESIGMFSMFLVFLGFALALKFLDKKDKSLLKVISLGLLVALLTTFSISAWGGGAVFIFFVVPLSFLVFWMIKHREIDRSALRSLAFYGTWIVFSVLFGVLFGYSITTIFNRFVINTNGLISLFVMGFIIVDYGLSRVKSSFIKNKYRQLYTLVTMIILGTIGLIAIGRNPFSLIYEIWEKLLHPFGLGRVGLTVAENAQPYLTDWIAQTGKVLFWFFYLGCLLIGVEISRGIRSKISRIYFSILWILMVSGILFSRISSGSVLNGINFISQAFYLIGLLLFVVYAGYVYFNKDFDVSPELMIMAAWMFAMIISGRAAIRLFFAVTPFVCFASSLFIIKLYEYYKASKDDLFKMVFGVTTIIVLLLAIVSIFGFAQAVSSQSKYTGPSANEHWQKAMAWVRENTLENSLFVHWWDYGYWVQYLGERPTVTDGGHANGYWDHLVGRYLLTTPNPETALSYMKSHNVSYLLIDPTDIGKYPAYSSIGSDDNHDRYSGIIAMLSDQKQIQETSEGEIRVYQGTFGVEEDTIYNDNGTEIFLPGPTYDKMNRPEFKSFIGGVIIETARTNTSSGFKQPQGVFFYGGKQIKIPLRYIFYNGQIFDFGEGLDAGVKIIPRVIEGNSGMQIDPVGAAMYLSSRTFNSLIGQLYLLEDRLDKYNGVEIAHIESSPVVRALKSQGITGINEFVYYRGIQGPIKIWKVEHRDNIIARGEFLSPNGDWAEFDDLEFIENGIQNSNHSGNQS